MSQASAYVAADGAPLGQAPSGTVLHQRAAITNTAAALYTFITPAGAADRNIPYRLDNAGGPSENLVFPKAVNMQLEAAQTTWVYLTVDGHDTALGEVSATLGMNIVPLAPNWLRIPVDCNPYVGANGTGMIRAISSSGTVNVQLLFEF